MITSSRPEAIASSTPYWMVGLSTSGSISLGCALVTGRNLVPSPAAGKIALRTLPIQQNVRPMAVESFPEVEVGLEGRTEREIDEQLLTHHVGGRGVFATPAMIGLMEMTAHRLLEPLIPAGYTTVGYEVHVRHLAPSAP